MIIKPQGSHNYPKKGHTKKIYRESLEVATSGSTDNTETNVTKRNREIYQTKFLTNYLKQRQKQSKTNTPYHLGQIIHYGIPAEKLLEDQQVVFEGLERLPGMLTPTNRKYSSAGGVPAPQVIHCLKRRKMEESNAIEKTSHRKGSSHRASD